jgi:hypothetical protein
MRFPLAMLPVRRDPASLVYRTEHGSGSYGRGGQPSDFRQHGWDLNQYIEKYLDNS